MIAVNSYIPLRPEPEPEPPRCAIGLMFMFMTLFFGFIFTWGAASFIAWVWKLPIWRML